MYYITSTGLSDYLESSLTVVSRQLNNHSVKNQSYSATYGKQSRGFFAGLDV